MGELQWQVKAFHQLNVEEYHEIIYLRTAVFVVEQNCPYQEVDTKDKRAFHLFASTSKAEVIAVTRILPKGVSYEEISIGRVALKKEYRGKGIADTLMQKSIEFVEKNGERVPSVFLHKPICLIIIKSMVLFIQAKNT